MGGGGGGEGAATAEGGSGRLEVRRACDREEFRDVGYRWMGSAGNFGGGEKEENCR